MKDKKKIFLIIKIIVIIVVIVLGSIFSLSYKINNNQNYKKSIINNIKKHYSISKEITYINTFGNNYIFTTDDKVYVLDNNYKEIYKDDISKIAKNSSKYDLIYKSKKLMYVNTTIKGNKLTYDYYDAKSYKKIGTTNMEK